MSRSDAVRRAAPVRYALTATLGAWWVGTVLSQHPHRAFDRLRDFEPLGLLIPNWRFFAPEPARHDYHVLHRVLTADDAQSEWRETITTASRTWGHTAWYPGRRENKAVSDIANELVTVLGMVNAVVEQTVPFELLRDRVEMRVREEWADGPPPKGFQFLVAQHTGYAEEEEPEYLMVSPFIPLERPTSGPAASTPSPERTTA